MFEELFINYISHVGAKPAPRQQNFLQKIVITGFSFEINKNERENLFYKRKYLVILDFFIKKKWKEESGNVKRK